MIKKVACFFIALAAIVGILFLVHAKVDSYHGSGEDSHASEQVEGNSGHVMCKAKWFLCIIIEVMKCF